MQKTGTGVAIVEEYKQHLLADGKSPSTIESYIGDVAGFLGWMEERGQLFTVNMKRLFVTSFCRHLVEENFEVATVNKKVNSLQSFNNLLIDNGYMTEQVIGLNNWSAVVKITFGNSSFIFTGNA